MTEEPPKILIADDQEVNIEVMRHFLAPKGYEIFAALGGKEALDVVTKIMPDVIILDLVMPDMNGYEVCQAIKNNPQSRHIPVIILTGAPQEEANIRALDSGADDFLQRPFNASFLDARIRNCIRTKRLQDNLLKYKEQLEEYNTLLEVRVQERTQQVERTQYALLFSLAKLAESRDPETGRHLERIRTYAKELTAELKKDAFLSDVLTDDFSQTLFHACPLHDIGKVGIPDRILLKPGKLTTEEFEIMKMHTEIGGDTLLLAEKEAGGSSLIAMARSIAYYHHERWDGSGYPKGLEGENIPIEARIVGLADCYDALVSRRAYKEPFSHEKARDIILSGRETQFDPKVVDAFLKLEDVFQNTREVLTDTGETPLIQQIMSRLGVTEF
ncbi:MAG TPA: response regulator [Candidatus Hydrogenedentes bacterium]|nr:response regulator [Candidatus Hydrogenedentota bacterium]HOL75420.1 response regulator [Candidatus Hydrogenedentota bacterium]HPO84929.1 response regulator [Candidatus Hydrogenedentota bacterium]